MIELLSLAYSVPPRRQGQAGLRPVLRNLDRSGGPQFLPAMSSMHHCARGRSDQPRLTQNSEHSLSYQGLVQLGQMKVGHQ